MPEAALAAAAGAPAPASPAVPALRPRSPPLAPGRCDSSHPPCRSPRAVPQAGAASRQRGRRWRGARVPDTGLC